MQDVQLLQRFSEARSQEAFRELVDRHGSWVYSVCVRRLGGDRALAEDAAQAVFVALAQRAATLAGRKEGPLVGWLHAAARHVTANMRRERFRRERRE